MILDGKSVSLQIRKEIKREIQELERKPTLALILVGSHSASLLYVTAKKKACIETGMGSKMIELSDQISEIDLIREIEALNQDPFIDGILVQLPLPSHISEKTIAKAISPDKDVDGFHPLNAGKLLLGEEGGFIPCTPLGIHALLQKYEIPIEGKQVVIVGRSNLVGKPLAALLMQKKSDCNATVTVAHSRSEHLKEILLRADIVIAALGKPRFIDGKMIRKGACVIDVGINRLPDGSVTGDVDFASVSPIASHITPVPGGIGPMTIAMLLKNTLSAYRKRELC